MQNKQFIWILFSQLCLMVCQTIGFERAAEKAPKLVQIRQMLDDEFNRHLQSIERLRDIWTKFEDAVKFQNPEQLNPDQILSQKLIDSSKMDEMSQAYMIMTRVWGAIDELNLYIEQEESDFKSRFEVQNFLPNRQQLISLQNKIAKLLIVYDLTPDKMNKMRRSSSRKRKLLKMTYRDFYEFGLICYERNLYERSLEWFLESIKRANDKELEDTENVQEYLPDILDHAAFAAYKSGRLDAAIGMTQLLLEVSPDHERARENLQYYIEELEESGENSLQSMAKPENESDEVPQDYHDYYPAKPIDVSTYNIEYDEVVKRLCQGAVKRSLNIRAKCESHVIMPVDNSMSPKVQIEILSDEPRIIRIHDIITEKEAQNLMAIAEPKLYRSTVQTSTGTTTSDFRMADTAWLSRNTHLMIDTIEQRLSKLLNLDFDESEDLQVVNYELGGFYGPHLDAATDAGYHFNETKTERMATILMYLNEVDAGGATVFPRLNLTVEPIARSAVIWNNLKKNGYIDPMTLHTSCPVLMGTKWIATKWPRDKPNTFKRPCGLTESE